MNTWCAPNSFICYCKQPFIVQNLFPFSVTVGKLLTSVNLVNLYCREEMSKIKNLLSLNFEILSKTLFEYYLNKLLLTVLYILSIYFKNRLTSVWKQLECNNLRVKFLLCCLLHLLMRRWRRKINGVVAHHLAIILDSEFYWS